MAYLCVGFFYYYDNKTMTLTTLMILNGRQLLLHRSKDLSGLYLENRQSLAREHLEKCIAFGKLFYSKFILFRSPPPHKHLPVDKNILTAGWKFCSDGRYFIRSIADEAKCAPRTWLKCSIIDQLLLGCLKVSLNSK
jgi:hypothetical protein